MSLISVDINRNPFFKKTVNPWKCFLPTNMFCLIGIRHKTKIHIFFQIVLKLVNWRSIIVKQAKASDSFQIILFILIVHDSKRVLVLYIFRFFRFMNEKLLVCLTEGPASPRKSCCIYLIAFSWGKSDR